MRRFDLEKMRRDFLSSDLTLRDLAKRHGCSYRYVSGISSAEQWYAKRKDKREATTREELARNAAARAGACAELQALSSKDHVDRSIFVGEQLHLLLQQAMTEVGGRDVRQLKSVIEAWAIWDKQMRTNHRLEDSETRAPLVDIYVMAALPRRSDHQPRLVESEGSGAAAI